MGEIIEKGEFDFENLDYKALSVADVQATKALHEEWFPINYPDKFYERIRDKTCLAIGCFYAVPLVKN